ncbi:hypothetical protein BUALT_Bualt05G0151100 [Buddleja alternifolia]|uniref:Uncharacterized protein n=1 Tax=Buddleja alternifolia TaxID=168488 RepID=A0AAV6XJH2_9LAMI|nr:hypothetical protein BUALT_Bualt05G0151100 [Buddleja alternifolia]
MADGTRIVELRKDVDGLKLSTERTEKSIEELKTMIMNLTSKIPTNVLAGGREQGASAEMGGDSPGVRILRFFEVDETQSDAKVKLAAVHLEGKALQFGVLLYDDPMAELMNLKQTGNIQEYLDKFDELMNCVELSENYASSCFLGSAPVIPSRRLSPQEMNEKRSKGLCFWCDEKFNIGHVCSKRKQLYILEVPENYSEEMEAEEVKKNQEVCEDNKIEEENVTNYHVSMNAMTGVHDFRTMRVNGTSQVYGGSLTTLTVVFTDLLQRIKTGWPKDEKIQKLIQKITRDPNSKPKYAWHGGVLTRKGRVVLGNYGALKKELLQYFHNSPIGGHSGIHQYNTED